MGESLGVPEESVRGLGTRVQLLVVRGDAGPQAEIEMKLSWFSASCVVIRNDILKMTFLL